MNAKYPESLFDLLDEIEEQTQIKPEDEDFDYETEEDDYEHYQKTTPFGHDQPNRINENQDYDIGFKR